ncbi:conserved hypothetical protein [Burkholderiales bacterium 8X]|nr:conserved hypothetical protein [Burkholderiales bacterium 8X]
MIGAGRWLSLSVRAARGLPGLLRSLLLLLLLAGGSLQAAPWVPANDAEIVETLPTVLGFSREERQLRRQRAVASSDAAIAVEAATAALDVARTQGDARYAGYAMAALRHWADQPPEQTPVRVLVMRATIAQFLHDFDGAEALLKAALARDPSQAQAWLTLATLHRVRGRYAESDAACRSVGRTGPALYGVACLAENAGLRGEHAQARVALQQLLADPALQSPDRAGVRQWLLTSVAEIEELAGRDAEAEAAYRQALAAERDGYLVLAYSDFLLRRGRAGEVAPLIGNEPRSDAVLLRLATASRAVEGTNKPGEELQARFDAAAQRPGAMSFHAREEALYALDVRRDAARALELARINLRLQREPIDMLVFARAAAATRNAQASAELQQLMREIGLRDARIDALR